MTETVIGAMENRLIAVMLMSVAMIAGLCVLAYTLAVYALPFMLAVEAARVAYATGSSLIGAGYALAHGVTGEAVPSEIWRQIFCIAGGGFVGASALLRLVATASPIHDLD